MIGFFRMAILGFIGLTLVYVVVGIYSRSVRREHLEKQWETDPAREGRTTAERNAYITAGMDAYNHSLRRKLIVLVYLIPATVFAITVYLVNYQ